VPEGHTIHRLARDLNRTLRPAQVVASSPQGRFGTEAALLDGRMLDTAEAWGKHLFVRFAEAPTLQVHLGLIGKLRCKPAGAPIVGQIRLRLETDAVVWDLTGPMICGLVDVDDEAAVVARLGPDPLRRTHGKDRFVENLSRRSIPIAAALLDQAVIAGIGNVYRSEFCFLAGIDPETPANSLSVEQAEQLWEMAVEQLRLGVRLNRIVTRDPDEVGVAAGRIPGDERLYVYQREGLPCHRCGTEIRLVEIAKRKARYCPTCQT